MFIAVARITLSIPESGSLKSKRHVVHKVLDKVKARFNVSIAEIADLDLWQKATLGIAAVGNEHAFAQECVSKVARYIEDMYVAPMLACSTEVIALGAELYGEDDGTSFGSTARGSHRTLAEAEQEAASRAGGLAEPEPEPPLLGVRQPRHGRGPRPISESERERAIEELRQRLRTARRDPSRDEDEQEP